MAPLITLPTRSLSAEICKIYIEALRQVIAKLDAPHRAEAADILDATEANLASKKPSKTVIATLLAALPALASISTIAASIAASL